MALTYITIATIDGEKFKNIETEANSEDEAESKAMERLKKNYVGEIDIIRTVEIKKWQKLLDQVL